MINSRQAVTPSRSARTSAEILAEVAGQGGGTPLTVFRYLESTPTLDDQLAVIVVGDVDLATAPLLEAALLDATDGHRRVCCDLRYVTFFGAAGVSALVAAHHRAVRTGSRLSVRGAHGNTRRILRFSGGERIPRSSPEVHPRRSVRPLTTISASNQEDPWRTHDHR
jgi:anti-anti-sigma factor